MPHDIVTAQMSADQRAAMYRLANTVAESLIAAGGNEDVRISTVALLRVIAAVMARNPWGRDPVTQAHISELLPLYVRAAIESNDGSRIIRPFTKLV